MTETTTTDAATTESHAAQQVRAHVETWQERADAVVKLREYEHETLADVRDRDGRDEVANVIAARELLELDALDVEDGEDETGDVAEGVDDVHERWGEGALDAYVKGTRRAGGEWDIEGAVVVVTTGGPHVQLEYDGRDVVVAGWDWFGADRTTRTLGEDAAELVVRAFALDLLMEDC